MTERLSVRKEGRERSPESAEKKELFRASLGLDFIFSKDETGNKRCFCVEINGDNAGVAGVGSIPKGDIDEAVRGAAYLRDTRNPKRLEKADKAKAIMYDLDTGEFPVSGSEAKEEILDYVRKSVLKEPLLSHAFRNPPFIQDIASRKDLQQQYIPAEYAPRYYREGESMISSTGFWICKPRSGISGKGIVILDDSQFAMNRSVLKKERFIAQEFIQPLGADKAQEGMKDNPASLRLLVDFKYLKDGSIEKGYETAYQRVSPFSGKDISRGIHGASREDIYVVNKSREASSVAPSEEEVRLAREAAEKIIRNLAAGYEKSLE